MNKKLTRGHVEAINRLCRNLPVGSKVEASAAEQTAMLLEAVSDCSVEDVERAVNNFITGKVKGHGVGWRPNCAQMGAEARRIMAERIHREDLARRYDPNYIDPNFRQSYLPPPERTDEGRRKVADLMRDFVNKHRSPLAGS